MRLNHATRPPPTTTRLPNPPKSMRREMRRWGGFPAGGGVSCIGGSIAPGAEVWVISACDGFTNVNSSDCASTGVNSGAEESGSGGMKVGALESIAGPGAFPAACSRALAKARRLVKRCCGSFARAVIITCSTSGEMVGIFSCKDGGEAKTCWVAISVKDP